MQITSEMSGSFRDLLLTLLRGERDESAEADPEAAEAQAEALHDSDGRREYRATCCRAERDYLAQRVSSAVTSSTAPQRARGL